MVSGVGIGLIVFSGMWVRFEDPQLRCHLIGPLKSIFTSYSNLLVYEALGVIYVHVDPQQKAVVALMLPIVKFCFRYAQQWLLKNGMEGLPTTIIAFESEFFSSLYISIFLQNTTNPITIVVLLIGDALQNVWFLYRLWNDMTHYENTQCPLLRRKVLFRTEKKVLIELVEVLTPIMYGIWLIALWNSPNLQFYQSTLRETNRSDFEASLWNLVLLIFLQASSLTIMMVVVTKRFGFPIWKQVGFVLEGQQRHITMVVLFWLGVAITGPFEHWGNVYSFDVSEMCPYHI